jgi:hypothetical protein
MFEMLARFFFFFFFCASSFGLLFSMNNVEVGENVIRAEPEAVAEQGD